VSKNTAKVITLSGADIDSASLTFAAGTAAHGTLSGITGTSCTASGSGTNCTAAVTYTPALDYVGPDSFTFTTNDGALTSPAATVTISMGNDPPVASGQSIATAEDAPLVITLSGTDANGDSLTFTAGSPAHGGLGPVGTPSCTVTAGTSTCTATVTYTPTLNYNGPDSFTFTVNDGTVDSTPATVTLTVTPVNDAPVANGQTLTTPEDTALPITLTATDVDSASLTFATGALPAHGSLGTVGAPVCTPSGGGSSCTATVTYTPVANYNGPDSFTFVANDGTVNSAVATVTLTVSAVNDAPTASAQTVAVSKNTAKVITLSGADIDSASLTFAAGTAAHGTLSGITGTSCTPSGSGTNCTASVTYTPNTNYTGPDSFTFTTNDGTLTSPAATVTITVANDPPVATGQSQTTPEDTPLTITLTGSDPNGDTLSFAIGTAPTNGSLGAITPLTATSASVIYTPGPNYNGPDNFTFTVNDGTTTSAAATVTLTITAVNDAPTAIGQTPTTPEDTPLVITLAASDIDSASLTFAIGTTPTHGSLGTVGTPVCTPSGGGTSCTATVTYTPAANYNGPDSFTFTANDGTLTSTPATVTLSVTAVNDAPTASAQSVTVSKNVAKVITLSGADIDSASLTFAAGTPANGTLSAITGTSCTPSGSGTSCTASVTYTPNTNYTGPDSFTFTTNDGSLGSTAATVTITVANDPPVAVNDTATVSKNSATNTINVLTNDSDPNGDPLTVTTVSTPAHGTAGVATGGGAVTYSPASTYTGSDSFTYTVSDGSGGTAAGTVTVTVVNDPPTASGQSASTAEDTPLLITLTGSDPNGDALTFAIGTAPTHGSLGVITPLTATSASVTYTPAANYNGPDGFTFVANDGTVNSSPATVTLTITPVNDPPVTTDHVVTAAQNSAGINFTLTASDIDSPSLTFSIVTGPTNGTLGAVGTPSCTASGSGSTCTAQVTYTPTTGYTGADSFTYQASDGSLTSNVSTVNATVFVDSDGDGIEDAIDTQPAAASNDFNDPNTAVATLGTINSRGDRVVNLSEEPPLSGTSGVRLFVTMGTQTAQITANCPTQIVIQVQPGNTYEGVVICGSATVKTTSGRAKISNVTNTTATVATVVIDLAAGQTVKFDTNTTGNLTQTLSTTNSSTTPLTTAINNTPVTAALQSGTAVTYTVGAQNSVTATAMGGTVPVSANGQTTQIAQGDTASVAVGLLPGDVDGSGRVDGKDLIELSAAFGSSTSKTAWNANADQNKDGTIDGSDLMILASHFGAVQ
jgi:hypothetical protein